MTGWGGYGAGKYLQYLFAPQPLSPTVWEESSDLGAHPRSPPTIRLAPGAPFLLTYLNLPTLRASTPFQHPVLGFVHDNFLPRPASFSVLSHRQNFSGPAVVVTTYSGEPLPFLTARFLASLVSRCFLLCQSICVFSFPSLSSLSLSLSLRLRLPSPPVSPSTSPSRVSSLAASTLPLPSLLLSRSRPAPVPAVHTYLRILFERRDSCCPLLASPTQSAPRLRVRSFLASTLRFGSEINTYSCIISRVLRGPHTKRKVRVCCEAWPLQASTPRFPRSVIPIIALRDCSAASICHLVAGPAPPPRRSVLLSRTTATDRTYTAQGARLPPICLSVCLSGASSKAPAQDYTQHRTDYLVDSETLSVQERLFRPK